jgi:hypothetical protein
VYVFGFCVDSFIMTLLWFYVILEGKSIFNFIFGALKQSIYVPFKISLMFLNLYYFGVIKFSVLIKEFKEHTLSEYINFTPISNKNVSIFDVTLRKWSSVR